MSVTKTLKLRVIGDNTMHCGGCERTVQFTLSQLPGVQAVRADHNSQDIEVDLAAGETALETVVAELDWIGYRVEAV